MADTLILAGREDFSALALSKLTRILGDQRGAWLYDQIVASMKVDRLSTPEDLYAFAAHLSARGGMDGAVGGMLSVAAVLRGAKSADAQPDSVR